MSILRVRDEHGNVIDIPTIRGEPGKDGITPHIGANGNWFLGETDTGMPSRGEDAPQEAILYTPQDLTPEQQAQARENIGAVGVDDLPSVEAGGLTIAQINALDGLFRTAAYTTDASGKYAEFRVAFGLDEPSEPDVPDVPSGDWETVRVLTSDEIKYGTHVTNQSWPNRCTYSNLDIPVAVGYIYRAVTELVTEKSMKASIMLWDTDAGAPSVSNWTNNVQYEPGWFSASDPLEVEVTASNLQIKDINKNLCLMVVYKNEDDSDIEANCIASVTITRKAVS